MADTDPVTPKPSRAASLADWQRAAARAAPGGDLEALAVRWPAWHPRLAGFLMQDPLRQAREQLQELHARLRTTPQHDLFAAPVEPAG